MGRLAKEDMDLTIFGRRIELIIGVLVGWGGEFDGFLRVLLSRTAYYYFYQFIKDKKGTIPHGLIVIFTKSLIGLVLCSNDYIE